MIRITPSAFPALQEWHDTAIERPAIARFIGMGKVLEAPKCSDYDNDWNRIGYLSASRLTYLRVDFQREYDTASIAVWSVADGMQRCLEVGRLLMHLRNSVLPTYAPAWVTASVHSTNTQSLRLMSRIFGGPWGIEPSGAWDRGLGTFVDCHCFRRRVEELGR